MRWMRTKRMMRWRCVMIWSCDGRKGRGDVGASATVGKEEARDDNVRTRGSLRSRSTAKPRPHKALGGTKARLGESEEAVGKVASPSTTRRRADDLRCTA